MCLRAHLCLAISQVELITGCR